MQQAPVAEVQFVDGETGQRVKPKRSGLLLKTTSGAGLATRAVSADADGRLVLKLDADMRSLDVAAKGYREMTVPLAGLDSAGEIYNVVLDPLVPPPELQADHIDSLRRPDAAVTLGYVTDGSTLLPIAGVRVSCIPAGDSVLTDERGFFTLHVPLPTNGLPGSLIFEHEGHQIHRRDNLELWPYADWIYRIDMKPGEGFDVVDERDTRRQSLFTPEVLRGENLKSYPSPRASRAAEAKEQATVGAEPAADPLLEPSFQDMVAVALDPSASKATAAPKAFSLPATIRVKRADGVIDVVSLQTYCKRVLASEWISSWGSFSGGINSLKAGSVAIRTYAAGFIYYPLHSSYDICATTSCQVYNPNANNSLCNTAVDGTAGCVVITPGATKIPRYQGEFSAENNSKGFSCGDGYTQPTSGCLYDPVCKGETRFGHGRGMCQWGTARWATGYKFAGKKTSDHSSNGYPQKDWIWICTHYYPTLQLVNGSGGSLKVTIGPSGVTGSARWRVDGGAWQASGATVGGLSAGAHTVSFNAVAGWDTPANASVTVAAGQTAALSRSYVRHVGSLKVTIDPAAAASAGARWRRTGTTAWLASGSTETGLPTGSYVVEFNSVDGWAKPANATVSVAKGATASVTGTYTEQGGGLQVTIGPAELAAGEARWRRTGTTTWRTSGSAETGVPAGVHEVEFLAVAGWDTPANASVTVAVGGTATLGRSYVRQYGALRVTISPAAAAAAGARWRRTGTTTWRTSGSTETNIPAGACAVEFNALASPWVQPANLAAAVAKNATNALNARYNRPPALADPGSHLAHVGAVLDFQVTASDPDGDGLFLSVSNAPAGGTLSSDGGTGTFHFTASPAQAGQTFAPVFTATESQGGLTDSKSASIRVGSPPTVAAPSNRTAVVGVALSFTVGASDPENDSKTFGMSGAPAGATLTGTGDSRTFSYTASPGDMGKTFALVFTATDADGTGSRTMSLRVKSPPVFVPVNARRVRAGGLLVLAVEASDPDGDAMSFQVAGQPASAHFTAHPAGGVFAFRPAIAEIGRTYEVQFRGTDVDGTQVMTVAITVVGPDEPVADYDLRARGALGGFGGPSAGATRRNFAAGAQGQPVGRNASGTWRNSGGVLVPEPGGAARALFEAQRTVQGVPYGWLLAYGLTNQPWDEAAALDQGAGMAAWEAWVAGTDPTNPATAFRVEAVNPANGRVRVAVRTVPGRRYTFSGASSLTAPDWRPLDYGLTPDGALANGPLEAAAERTEIYVPAGTGVLFLRSQVRDPENQTP